MCRRGALEAVARRRCPTLTLAGVPRDDFRPSPLLGDDVASACAVRTSPSRSGRVSPFHDGRPEPDRSRRLVPGPSRPKPTCSTPVTVLRGLRSTNRRLPAPAPAGRVPLAVLYKYLDDQGGYLAALMTYYAFASLFPLLLILATVLGIVLNGDAGEQNRLLHSALAEFPVIGGQLQAPKGLSGGAAGLTVGVLGALYGGLGVAQALQNAMNTALAGPAQPPPEPGQGPWPEPAAPRRHRRLRPRHRDAVRARRRSRQPRRGAPRPDGRRVADGGRRRVHRGVPARRRAPPHRRPGAPGRRPRRGSPGSCSSPSGPPTSGTS